MHWFKKRRKELGFSQQALADEVDVTRQMIGEYDKGAQPRPPVAKKLAVALKVPESRFDPILSSVRQVDTTNEVNTIPVYRLDLLTGETRGLGEMRVVEALAEREFVTVQQELTHCYAVQLTDDSMSPDFAPGDIAIIDPSYEPYDGCEVLAIFPKGKSIVRRYTSRGKDRSGTDVFDLSTPNPNHKTITVNSQEPAEIKGVVIERRSRRVP